MSEPQRDPGAVRAMFDGIAGRYDLLNHLLSLNQDRRWRRAAARELLAEPAPVILDLCGGTGDLSLELARQNRASTIICCDFSVEMLRRAAEKFRRRGVAGRCLTLDADGLRLPLGDDTVDAVSVAFGVRNFADLDAGFREILRVLRPGGRLVVLEFSRPTVPVLSSLYGFYLRRVLPRIGDGVSGRHGPYGYLARTISGFPDPAALADRIRRDGFDSCSWNRLSGGIVAVHTARKRRS